MKLLKDIIGEKKADKASQQMFTVALGYKVHASLN